MWRTSEGNYKPGPGTFPGISPEVIMFASSLRFYFFSSDKIEERILGVRSKSVKHRSSTRPDLVIYESYKAQA